MKITELENLVAKRLEEVEERAGSILKAMGKE